MPSLYLTLADLLMIPSELKAELFYLLPPARQHAIFPEERAQEAMGITGFTMPAMFRWVRSDLGRGITLHPFQHGHFLPLHPLREARTPAADPAPPRSF